MATSRKQQQAAATGQRASRNTTELMHEEHEELNKIKDPILNKQELESIDMINKQCGAHQ